jgi:hypothetical protein
MSYAELDWGYEDDWWWAQQPDDLPERDDRDDERPWADELRQWERL